MRLLPFLALLAPVASFGAGKSPAPILIWQTDGLIAPESVVFDYRRQEYYVSNMGTYGTGEVPGDGFISRVSSEGTLVELKWVQGLENPKGLVLVGDRLFVGDDLDLVAINVTAGKVTARHQPIDGPGGFNDCTADEAGNVYVCSNRLSTVFRLSTAGFEPWSKFDARMTGGVNGLLAEKDRLLLGGWTWRKPDGTELLGHLTSIAFSNRTFTRVGDEPICHIDGIASDGAEGYIVSDWLTGEIFHVTSDGRPNRVLTLSQGAEDHTYRVDQQLLIVPLTKSNALQAYRWYP